MEVYAYVVKIMCENESHGLLDEPETNSNVMPIFMIC